MKIYQCHLLILQTTKHVLKKACVKKNEHRDREPETLSNVFENIGLENFQIYTDRKEISCIVKLLCREENSAKKFPKA